MPAAPVLHVAAWTVSETVRSSWAIHILGKTTDESVLPCITAHDPTPSSRGCHPLPSASSADPHPLPPPVVPCRLTNTSSEIHPPHPLSPPPIAPRRTMILPSMPDGHTSEINQMRSSTCWLWLQSCMSQLGPSAKPSGPSISCESTARSIRDTVIESKTKPLRPLVPTISCRPPPIPNHIAPAQLLAFDLPGTNASPPIIPTYRPTSYHPPIYAIPH